MPLGRAFYDRPVLDVAPDLLGCLLVHRAPGGRRIARIVETEAYRGRDDRASHAFRGVTPRTRIMFGPPGFAYVYLIYGMYSCLNVVTDPEGEAAAVLIRAAEAVDGLPPSVSLSGPGRLCRGMDIDGTLNGTDLTGGLLWLEKPVRRPASIRRGPRIGVDYAGSCAKRPWRFWEEASPAVSKKR